MGRKSMSIWPQIPTKSARMTGKLAWITDKVRTNDRKTWPDWPQGAWRNSERNNTELHGGGQNVEFGDKNIAFLIKIQRTSLCLKIQNAFPDPGNASLGLLTKEIYQQKFFFQTKNIYRPNFSFRPKFFSDQKNVWQKKFLTIFFPTINFFWQFFFLQPKKISDQKYVRPNSFSNQPNWLWHNSKLT